MGKPDKAAGMTRGAIPAAMLAALPLLSGAQVAQTRPNVWASSGPEAERLFRALTIDPRKPRILYAATWGGGIFKSTDRGESWRPASTGLTNRYVTSLAIDSQTPTTLYAGTRDLEVFKSTDAGDTWRGITRSLREAYSDYRGVLVETLAVDPRNPDTLYAGTGMLFGLCCGWVFKSTDGGESWSRALGGLGYFDFTQVLDLAIDPQTPTTLYMVGRGREWHTGPVFKSTDGGATWRNASTGLPTLDQWVRYPPAPVLAVAIDPREPTTLYAGTSKDGVFKSTDGGSTWRPARSGLPSLQGTYHSTPSLGIDPREPTTLYVSVTAHGSFKSVDGGGTWVPANSGASLGTAGEIVIDPWEPETLYVVGDDHIFRSSDGGSQWSNASKGIVNTQVFALAVDLRNPGTVYAGTQELFGYGLRRDRIFKSTDRGGSWSPASTGVTTRDVSTLAIDPQTPTTLYAGTGGGLYKSADGGGSWSWIDWYPGNPGFGPPYVTRIAVDPRTPNTVYLGTSNHYGVFKSTDGGASWTAINAGLDGLDGRPPWIGDIVIDPQTPTTLYMLTRYAGLDGVFKSTDGGASWRATNTGLTYFDGYIQRVPYVHSLEINPQTPTILYVGTLDNGVFRTDDGGARWRAVNSGLDSIHSRAVNALAVNPRNPATLYAGNHDGVYQSTDGGASWSALNAGLDGLVVVSLAIDPHPPGAVYAGTWGGGVFVLSPAPAPGRIGEPTGLDGGHATREP